MNVIDVFQKCLVYACLAGAAVCFLAVLAYHFRDQLRALHERWLGLGPFGRVVSILAVTLAVLYGGTKSPTNEVTGDGATGTGATGVSPVAEGVVARNTGATGIPVAGWGPDGQDARRPSVSDGQDARWPSALRPMAGQMVMSPQLTNQPTNQLTTWTARGAFSDWQRIDFPESFAFPHGTNLLTSITLFAYGEIRESLHQLTTNNQQLTTLPTAVSLSPGESAVTYGLTPSNSFLIAWQNACVDRSATNRVDASIELFRSGAILITTQLTNQPTNKLTNYFPPQPPPGFVGIGQDNAWALANFPDDYAAITNKGYEAWLDEDYVGVSEQNGHYKASITIDQQPTTNNQQPLYLVCGPHKVVVTSPGTYSFPLEVFETYKVRTYPVALPLAISTDDGYRGDVSPGLMMSAPRRMLASPPNGSFEYEIREEPRLVISPSWIPLSEAAGAVISIWCNVAEGASRLYSSLSGLTTVSFTCPSEAEIEESMVEDAVEFILETPKGSCSGYVYIGGWWDEFHPYHWCCWSCCGPDCRCDGTCCGCNCGCRNGLLSPTP